MRVRTGSAEPVTDYLPARKEGGIMFKRFRERLSPDDVERFCWLLIGTAGPVAQLIEAISRLLR